MKIWHSSSSESKPCVVCGKKTGTYKVYEQTNIALKIPACNGDHYNSVDVKEMAAASISLIKKVAMRG
ncbi:hypothetical protein ACUXCC_002943 [Cytobacillus horneckiae]|uniref:hypothetical protein n=1 Tax=Cytobacillus horneckiae TaxID=549687 RepID=UPI0019CF4CEA|nr:hypothetical protein [Cytobacillus horneckiae]MBN6887755.1 hypothetical protein [Cytobacillus horneckiae]